MIDKTVNSGPDAQTGFALQRNTALYLILENYYTKFKDKKYFICLEHHDDFLFCFLDEYDRAKSIEAYQSKKKSPNIWSLNAEMYEILSKLLNTSKNISTDSIPKTYDCKNQLFFTSNQTMSLDYEIIEDSKKKTKTVKIKEDNYSACYVDLPKELKVKIKNGISNSQLHGELENLYFFWIDLNRTVIKQENQLVGQLGLLFPKKISDPRAAIDSLISLFSKIEVIYNQGNISKLLDESKRVSSDEIESTLNILTTKSKAFEEWRDQKESVSDELKIKHFERDTFELKFHSAFDLFKVLTESEHQKILNYVRNNYLNCQGYKLGEIISELFDNFLKVNNSAFSGLDLKAIIYAAYFEATFKRQN